MNEEYFGKMRLEFRDFLASDQVEHYVKLFPELNSHLSKFARGIFLWNRNGLININNPDDVSKVRLILKVLDQTPCYDFFDNVFNDAGPDVVCEIIGMSPATPIEEDAIEFDYSISEIKTFEDAHSYFEMVSWCIVISEESFNEYTTNGNRFYFCSNGDWWETPCIPGMSFPYDKYGYSLIAVEMTPDNKVASVTSRWNTCAGDTENFLSPEELPKVLGEENYKKLLLTHEYSEEGINLPI